MGNCQNNVTEKQLSSTEAVREAIKEVWAKEILADYFNNLILSMAHYIQAVIKKGSQYKILIAGLF